ncbi:glycoside hydrolase family 5 protein [Patellaria atrata CBS 101060]|uniref:mannan endo-1,4-beta-mannosidase n=1 Tax=Patellaria atrata CBS 101060 TaxID=1346257 RepID=A0A9P4VLH7_9PEZI|nr:glycoside hydrolase family 5 protein [Patellaria atrata CBS 101060]
MKSLYYITFAAAASAQQLAWAQCGGQGWSGSNSCVSGYTCVSQNDYYFQCVPGEAGKDPTFDTLLATAPATGSTASPPASVADSFSATSGTKFVVDGKTGYFAGTNSYWIAFLMNNADIDLVMDHLKQSGLKILRVWGFNDVTSVPGSNTVWFQSFVSGQSPQINTGANGLQRLDYVVKSAEARGIKLIINFVNYWDDYGGMSAYTRVFGGTKDNWYTNTRAQDAYRNYIKTVVNRYINSPAVFAWELANEPRCKGCATSVLTKWASDTSAYIKSLDSKHMVTLGDEGFGPDPAGDGSYPYQTSEGSDWRENLKIKTLDFGTFHLYPDSWGTNHEWGNRWIKTHGDACRAAGKPCMLEEYGSTPENQHCPVESKWQTTSLNNAGMGADLFWQLGDTLSTGQTHNDGHTKYYGSSDWTCLVTNHIKAIPAPA